MSEGDDGQGEKQYDPSAKKLEDARRKGEVPRSADLISASGYAGFLLVGVTVGAATISDLGVILAGLFDRADSLADLMFRGSATAVTAAAGADIARTLAPWALVPGGVALVSVLAQRAFTVTGSKLQPKLSRISVLANARNKFGRAGLFEFGKSLAKLLIYSLILGVFLWWRLPDILGAAALAPQQVTGLMLRLALAFFLSALAVLFTVGAVDFLWQQAEHLRRNRMSHKDLTDESKESEGDPQLKQHRRQRAYDIATNRMMRDVSTSDVVIVNPTHYAVALKWDRTSGRAPICVAKGVDEIALRIRLRAEESGVPLHRDPPTARLLHGLMELGEEVRPDHYAVVAAAIRFAEDMRRKARAR